MNIWNKVKNKVFNKNWFYKPIFPLQKIKEFFLSLRRIARVSLMLYTSLDEKVADAVL